MYRKWFTTVGRGEAIMLEKLNIILFSNSHYLPHILPIILKIMLGFIFMAFQTANNIPLIK